MKKHYYTREILEICDNKHLTVDEIYNQIKIIHPNVGKSSIYRNVEDLALDGELTKINGIDKKAFFEKTKKAHIHLVDTNSGEIVDFDINDEILSKIIPNDFQANSFDVKVFGAFRK